jgi:hypothetical protein
MKCKNCKDQFIPKTFLQKHCMVRPECVEIFVSEVKAKQWKKKKAEMKKELMTLSDYLKLAQAVFNKFIRQRDIGQPCISCGATAGKYTITAGHYFPSTNKSVTFNEDNLHGQCWFNCNSSKSGNLIEYRKGLIQRIGLERLEILENEARKTKNWTIDELKEIVVIYKDKCKTL